MDADTDQKRELLDDLRKTLHSMGDDITDMGAIVQMHIQGAMMLADMPDPVPLDLYRQVEIARRELNERFRRTFSHALIATWALLQASVDEVLVTWLDKHPTAFSKLLEQPQLIKARVPIGFLELGRNQRVRAVLRLIRETNALGQANVVTTYETLFRQLGLNATEVEKDTKTALIEFQYVRNALVHHNGVANEELVAHCPQLGYNQGENVLIDEVCYDRYMGATRTYSLLILHRMVRQFGTTTSGREEDQPGG